MAKNISSENKQLRTTHDVFGSTRFLLHHTTLSQWGRMNSSLARRCILATLTGTGSRQIFASSAGNNLNEDKEQ